jgi:hypothetical protein
MGMNCKPGDLAIVVRDEFTENIGRVVEVKSVGVHSTDLPAWKVVAHGTPLRILWIDRAPETYLDFEAEAYDADLMPISGVPLNDEVTDDLEVTA